jgi:hypothetical protein
MQKVYTTLILFFLIGLNTFGQNGYTFEKKTGTYQDLTGSTSLNNGKTWDDPDYEIPIGFDFNYFGQKFNEVYFDGSSFLFFTSSGNDEFLSIAAPFLSDVVDRGYDLDGDEGGDGSLSSISFKREGAEGNRIFKFEMNNVGFYDDMDENDSSNSYANLQIWLYEKDYSIEFHYGKNEINPEFVFNGDGPNVVLLYNFDSGNDRLAPNGKLYALEGQISNPTFTNVPSNMFDIDMLPTLSGIIPDGTVYRFIPSTTVKVERLSLAATIYPNPAKDMLTIANVNFDFNKIQIINTLGQEVKTIYDKVDNVDIADLNSGVYFIRLVSDNAHIEVKFVKL